MARPLISIDGDQGSIGLLQRSLLAELPAGLLAPDHQVVVYTVWGYPGFGLARCTRTTPRWPHTPPATRPTA